jgi:hypothetical protein
LVPQAVVRTINRVAEASHFNRFLAAAMLMAPPFLNEGFQVESLFGGPHDTSAEKGVQGRASQSGEFDNFRVSRYHGFFAHSLLKH